MSFDRYPGNQVISQYMKLFKRFLKENGKYNFMMNLMFKSCKRSIEDFYNDVERLYNDYARWNFGDILHITYTLGGTHMRLGHDHWLKAIKPLSDAWMHYFAQHLNKIENDYIPRG